MDKVNITIIGAGVVGLAVAARLSRPGLAVTVLEKNESFGQDASSRNSEVMHSGIYYPPESLKAKLCVSGNALLYNHCLKFNVNHIKLGKIIVATERSETELLEALYENGRNNGLQNIELITRKQARNLEPNIDVYGGLFCADTGIIDSHGLMQSFISQASSGGTMLSYKSEVTSINKTANGFEVAINNGSFVFQTGIIINCAGLYSEKIASFVGIDTQKAGYKIHYCKGNYFRTTQKLSFKKLIYPVPAPNAHGLGIHLTLDFNGGYRFGPDTQYTDKLDYAPDETRKDAFYEAVRKYIPDISKDLLYPDTSGIRSKLQGPGEGFRDFEICDEKKRDLPGFINLVGIESPGLTSSIAMAEYVEKLALQYL